jgi:amidase
MKRTRRTDGFEVPSGITDAGLSRRKLLLALGSCAAMPLYLGCSKSSPPAPEQAASTDSLHYLTLRELASRIESGDVSPVEITRRMLERITTVDAQLHSYQAVFADAALAAAREAEAEIRRGDYRGALHGVPVAVKDLFYAAGQPTTGGLSFRRDFVPDFDATAVARLRAAGAILLGKLTTTEGAMVGYHRDFEIPVNPWGENLWAGVSSSGSGVATAAGLCFGALGTDTGGSIRFPSMANGIVGLKPTYGRVSRHGVLPLAKSLDHVGPMTRSVADAAIMLQAIAGFDVNDPTSLRAPVPDLLAALDRDIDGVRVGFDRRYALDGVPPGLAAAIETAVGELENLGAEVVEVEVPDVSAVVATWPLLCAAEAPLCQRSCPVD